MVTGLNMSLIYDSANRLTSAGSNNYTYDIENIRAKNLCGNNEIEYTYNTNAKLSQLLYTEDENGNVTKYIYGNGLIGELNDNGAKVYHFDYRGSTTAVTDEDGNITDTFKYDTYGKLISRTGTSNVIFLYNGRDGVITDSNGLLYMRARYYNPDLKRFVNADILIGEITTPVTLNRYAYANGNPVSNIDPFGLSAERGQNSSTLPSFNALKSYFGEAFEWAVDEFKQLTYDGKLDWLINLGIAAIPDKNGVYHIKQDWWQSFHFVGYNDIYDLAFDLGVGATGGSVAFDKFGFTTKSGEEYMIWVWKGDYINLGAGAEAGIYKDSIIPGHWLTSTENAMPMELSLKNTATGKSCFDYKPKQDNWWITGFKPLGAGESVHAEDLQSTVTIDFSNHQDLYESFYDTWANTWQFDGFKATLIW